MINSEGLYSNLRAEITKITGTIQNSDYSNSSELFHDSRFAESRLMPLDKVILSEKFHYEKYLIQEHQDIHWTEWIWGLFWLLAIEILGNGCLFATFVYERFGMDPQKRTVINQLLSQCCWTVMFYNITTFPAAIFRRLLGEVFVLYLSFSLNIQNKVHLDHWSKIYILLNMFFYTAKFKKKL